MGWSDEARLKMDGGGLCTWRYEIVSGEIIGRKKKRKKKQIKKVNIEGV